MNKQIELEDVLNRGEERVNDIFGQMLDRVDSFELTPEIDRLYSKLWEKQGMIAGTVGKYMAEKYYGVELDYVRELAASFDADFADWKVEKREQNLSIEEILTKPLGEILRFQDPQRQAEFSQRVQFAFEDIGYALEVAEFELQEIYDVKANTPVVGYFARLFGEEKIPEIRAEMQEGREYLGRQRETVSKIMQAMNFGLESQVRESSREEIEARYESNMASRGATTKQRVAEEYRTNGGVARAQPDLDAMNPEQRLAYRLECSRSQYNNALETAVGVIGAFMGYAADYVGSMFEEEPKRANQSPSK